MNRLTVSRAEHVARMVVCRANDVDPCVPDADIERLFSGADGKFAVEEARDGLRREFLIGIAVGVSCCLPILVIGWLW